MSDLREKAIECIENYIEVDDYCGYTGEGEAVDAILALFAEASEPSLEEVLENTPSLTGLNLTRNEVDGGWWAMVFMRPDGGSLTVSEHAEGPTIAGTIRSAMAAAGVTKGEGDE